MTLKSIAQWVSQGKKPYPAFKLWIGIFIIFTTLLPLQSSADIPKHNPVPGGVAVVYLPSGYEKKPRVRFGNKPVAVLSSGLQWYAIVGLSAETIPGNYVLSVSFDENPATSQLFRVDPLPSAQSRRIIGLPKSLENLHFQALELEKLITEPINDPLAPSLVPDFQFSPIVRQGQYIPYGPVLQQREEPVIVNHSWVTYLTNADSAVFTPGTAVVEQITKTHRDGFSVVLNHGMGTRSILSCMEDVIVEIGQLVEPGAMVGSASPCGVPSLGRVDWRLILNGNQVDPLPFFPSS